MLAPLLLLLLSASPALTVAPPAARPGDAVLLRVALSSSAPQGTLAGRALHFWRTGQGEYWALSALPIETRVGTARALVQADGSSLSAPLEVVEPGFTIHALTLDKKYVEPPRSVEKRIADDHQAFVVAFSRPFAPPLFQTGFDWPRRAPTSGRFGDQRVLNGKKPSVHYGLDITGPRGAPVAASNDGVVAIARNAYLSGNTVVIWHGAGIYTAYFHLDRMAVKTGERVARGEVIGALGATGRATGPHLHWGVKVDGLYIDPMSLLAVDFERGEAATRPAEPPAGSSREKGESVETPN